MDLSSFLGSDRGAGLGRVWNTRLLPRRVAWFYLRALRVAVAADDERAITSALRPPDLKRLLEIARGHDRVVELGTGAGWTAIALALDDPGRQVLSFDPDPDPGRARYLDLAGPPVGARIHLHSEPPHGIGAVVGAPAGLLIVNLALEAAQPPGAIERARAALRTGGVGVLHPCVPDTGGGGQAVARLGLPGRREGERLYVWREPEPPPPPPSPLPAAPAPPRRRLRLPALPSLRRRARARRARTGSARARWAQLAAVAAAVVLIGAAGTLALYEIDPDEGPDSATTTLPPEAAPPPPEAAAPPPGAGRERPRRSERAQRRSRRRSAGGRERSRRRGDRGRAARAYTGRGTRRIGTVRVRSDSVLSWRSSGGRLAISSSALRLESGARRGRTRLSRGIYRRFTVRAAGRWRVTIRPR